MSPQGSSSQTMKDSTMNQQNLPDLFFPTWLKPLLNATYFMHCQTHADSTKGECNFFCLTCKGSPLCSCCLLQHKKHPTLQIRRSSYNDVVRLDEISQYIDASNIQTYRINNARIIFLNDRPIIRPNKASDYACDICTRNLIDPLKFCSLSCKLKGVKSGHKEVTFNLSGESTQVGRKRLIGRWIDEHGLSDVDDENDRRSRKGIPHRAPFY